MTATTVSIPGGRRISWLSADGLAISPFDLPLAETQDGLLAAPGARDCYRRRSRSLRRRKWQLRHRFARRGAIFLPRCPKSGHFVRIEIGGVGMLGNEIAERSA
jgi:hypothetical protein